MKIFLDRDYFFNFVKQNKLTIIKVTIGLFVLTLAFIAFSLQSEDKQSFELNKENAVYDVGNVESEVQKTEADAELKKNEEVEEIFVDVSGAVIKPDVYKLKSGARVYEAVKLAGGFTENASTQNINLAAVLKDQDKLVILTEEEIEKQSKNGLNEAAKGSNLLNSNAGGIVNEDRGGMENIQGLVDLNTANQAELETLKGVGPAMAQRIIDYRNTKGAFLQIEELKNVKGIGEKMFEKIKDNVRI